MIIKRVFKALFSKSNLYVRRNPDPSLGLIASEQFGDFLTMTDFNAFENHYQGFSWQYKMLFLDDLALSHTFSHHIQKWHKKHPNSYLSNLFYGTNMIFLAWEARSSNLADEVKDSNWKSFQHYLDDAKTYLNKAIELNPNDAEAYTRMLQVFMGEGATNEKKKEYFEKAVSIEPLHIGAYLKMITNLTYKWGGSRDEMYDFAIASLEANNNHPLIALLTLFSFVEDWIHTVHLEENKKLDYWQQETIRNTVYTLYENQNDYGDLAILQPFVNNYFLFIFHRMRDWEKANILWKAHRFMTEKPWVYIGVNDSFELSNYLTKKK